jgi:thioredoxin reductase (NADPH)
MSKEIYDIVIIGGGVAGYSAALYGARFNLKTLVLTEEKGGRLQYTHLIENYPGAGTKSGPEIMATFEQQATAYGGEIRIEKVKGVIKEKDMFKVVTEEKEYIAKTVIIATGVERRKLNVPGEKEFQNKGVSFCATCDGALFHSKTVAIAGGSDSAAKEALLLTEYAKKVYIIYRGDKIRPEPINGKRVDEKVKNGKIEIINNANILEIKGNKMMTHIILDREHKGSKELKLDGVFIEIGGSPGSALAQELGVKLDERGYIITDKESRTNVPGVFAAGDVTSNPWKQGIIAASEGSFAAFSAFEYIKSKIKEK